MPLTNNTTPNNSNITPNISTNYIRLFHGNIFHAVELVYRKEISKPTVAGIIKTFKNKITRRSTINYFKLSISIYVTFSIFPNELL